MGSSKKKKNIENRRLKKSIKAQQNTPHVQSIIDNTSNFPMSNADKAKKYFNEGLKHLENARYDESIECSTKAIELLSKLMKNDPNYVMNYASAYYNRGNAYSGKGEYDLAIKDFNKAIEINPNDAVTYYKRGLTYSKKSEHDLAIKDYNKAIEINPKYVEAYCNRGIAYGYYKGDYDKAIEDYNKAIGINPKYVEAYCNRGIAYGHKGNYDKAIEDYTKAIELKPDYAIYSSRGTAYGHKGDYDKAIEDYTKAIDLKSDYEMAYYNRGTAYGRKGDYDKAIEDLTKAIDLKPDYADAYNNRSNAYNLKREYDKAKKDLTRAIDLKPDYADAYNNRGFTYYTPWTEMESDNIINPEMEKWLETIDPSELQNKIKEFRRLDFRNMSDNDIRKEISNVLCFNNQFRYVAGSLMYPTGMNFYRIRKLQGKLFDSLSDFWDPPPEKLTTYGRLNKPHESLLYTAIHPLICLDEMKMNADDLFTIIKYTAKSEIKVNVIGGDCDYKAVDIKTEKSKFIYEMFNNFLKDEFSRDVGQGTEFLYKISQIIKEDYFDLPSHFQDAWGYTSIQSKKGYNVCFRPAIAKEKLEFNGASICTTNGEIIIAKAVSYGFDENGVTQHHSIGSDIQKTYFPEITPNS